MSTLTIDDKEYVIEDLTDTARAHLSSIQLTDQRIAQLQADIAITQTARSAYVKALQSELN